MASETLLSFISFCFHTVSGKPWGHGLDGTFHVLKDRQPRAPKLFVGALPSWWKVQVLTTWASWLLWQGRDPSIQLHFLLGQIKERQVAGLLSVSLLSCGHPLSTSCSEPDTAPHATERRGTHDSFPPKPPRFLPLRALTGFYSFAPSLGGKSPQRVHALQVRGLRWEIPPCL